MKSRRLVHSLLLFLDEPGKWTPTNRPGLRSGAGDARWPACGRQSSPLRRRAASPARRQQLRAHRDSGWRLPRPANQVTCKIALVSSGSACSVRMASRVGTVSNATSRRAASCLTSFITGRAPSAPVPTTRRWRSQGIVGKVGNPSSGPLDSSPARAPRAAVRDDATCSDAPESGARR
jgi:hypothetical protein